MREVGRGHRCHRLHWRCGVFPQVVGGAVIIFMKTFLNFMKTFLPQLLNNKMRASVSSMHIFSFHDIPPTTHVVEEWEVVEM